jgi:MerR family transcriptional regulator, light-induced transcriptional regulator
MISEAIYLHYLNSLLDGDKKQCVQIVTGLLNQNVPLKEIYLDLLQRAMYRIGQMWENKRCMIANEHMATKITESLIELSSEYFSRRNRTGKTALITCVDKEFHELGARMVAGFMDAMGWDIIFIGSNTPQNEIIELIKKRKPDIVGISNNFYINFSRLAKLVDGIKQESPAQEIILGGQALAEGKSEFISQYENVHYIICLNELENYLKAMHG